MSIIEKAVDKMMGKLDSPVTARSPDQDRESHPASPADATSAPVPDVEVRHATPTAHGTLDTSVDSKGSTEALSPATVDAPGYEPAIDDGITDSVADPGVPSVSLHALNLEGVLAGDSDRSRTAEEYRMIKRPLLTRAFGQSGEDTAHRNLIMVTSSVEGEGKTFTSLNLAISIAMEMDRTVLLVDADLAKPGLSRLLQVNNLPGLTDRLLVDAEGRAHAPPLTVPPPGGRLAP